MSLRGSPFVNPLFMAELAAQSADPRFLGVVLLVNALDESDPRAGEAYAPRSVRLRRGRAGAGGGRAGVVP